MSAELIEYASDGAVSGGYAMTVTVDIPDEHLDDPDLLSHVMAEVYEVVEVEIELLQIGGELNE